LDHTSRLNLEIPLGDILAVLSGEIIEIHEEWADFDKEISSVP